MTAITGIGDNYGNNVYMQKKKKPLKKICQGWRLWGTGSGGEVIGKFVICEFLCGLSTDVTEQLQGGPIGSANKMKSN